MMPRAFRFAALAAAALLLPACVEADIESELKEDGSGSFGVSMKFTDKFVEIVQKMKKIDPDDEEIVKGTEKMLFEKPAAEVLADLEKRGLRLLEMESVNDEKRISAKMKVGYRNIGSMRHLGSLTAKGGKAGKDAPSDFTLTRGEDGVYTLVISMKDGPLGDQEEEIEMEVEEEPAGEEAEPGDGKPAAGKKELSPEEQQKKMQESFALMGELMGEASKLRFTTVVRVPGEVVSFEPATAGEKGEGKVTWNITFAKMMEMSMGGASENPMERFTVRFRMPEGKSIPEGALWAGEAKAGTPTDPAAPAKPAGDGE